jgi:Protein of unknown function (DUF1629)
MRKRAPGARCRTFYLTEYRVSSRPCGIKFLNEAEVFANGPPLILTPPGAFERGFRSYPVTPRFHVSKRFGRMPWDIERYDSYWLVSDHAKQVLVVET